MTKIKELFEWERALSMARIPKVFIPPIEFIDPDRKYIVLDTVIEAIKERPGDIVTLTDPIDIIDASPYCNCDRYIRERIYWASLRPYYD